MPMETNWLLKNERWIKMSIYENRCGWNYSNGLCLGLGALENRT